MTYMIDVQLEQGLPTLSLLNPKTGEKSFYWEAKKNEQGEYDWQNLFKHLTLFCCAHRMTSEAVTNKDNNLA